MDNEYFASINEVSKRLSVPAHTLRYWEKQFPVAIKPTTGAGGRRYYRTETVLRLVIIKELLYTRGMTIAGVKKLLRDGNLPENADDFMKSAPKSVPAQNVAPVARPQSYMVNTNELDTAITLLTQARDILAN